MEKARRPLLCKIGKIFHTHRWRRKGNHIFFSHNFRRRLSNQIHHAAIIDERAVAGLYQEFRPAAHHGRRLFGDLPHPVPQKLPRCRIQRPENTCQFHIVGHLITDISTVNGTKGANRRVCGADIPAHHCLHRVKDVGGNQDGVDSLIRMAPWQEMP